MLAKSKPDNGRSSGRLRTRGVALLLLCAGVGSYMLLTDSGQNAEHHGGSESSRSEKGAPPKGFGRPVLDSPKGDLETVAGVGQSAIKRASSLTFDKLVAEWRDASVRSAELPIAPSTELLKILDAQTVPQRVRVFEEGLVAVLPTPDIGRWVCDLVRFASDPDAVAERLAVLRVALGPEWTGAAGDWFFHRRASQKDDQWNTAYMREWLSGLGGNRSLVPSESTLMAFLESSRLPQHDPPSLRMSVAYSVLSLDHVESGAVRLAERIADPAATNSWFLMVGLGLLDARLSPREFFQLVRSRVAVWPVPATVWSSILRAQAAIPCSCAEYLEEFEEFATSIGLNQSQRGLALYHRATSQTEQREEMLEHLLGNLESTAQPERRVEWWNGVLGSITRPASHPGGSPSAMRVLEAVSAEAARDDGSPARMAAFSALGYALRDSGSEATWTAVCALLDALPSQSRPLTPYEWEPVVGSIVVALRHAPEDLGAKVGDRAKAHLLRAALACPPESHWVDASIEVLSTPGSLPPHLRDELQRIVEADVAARSPHRSRLAHFLNSPQAPAIR